MKKAFQKFSALLPLILLYAVFVIARPDVFGKFSTAFLIAQNAVIPCIMAWGLCLNFTIGIIDFSMGAELSLMTVVAVILSKSLGLWGLVLGVLFVGVCTATIKAFLFNITSANTMVLSVALTFIFGSMTIVVSRGYGLSLQTNMLEFGKMGWLFGLFALCMVLFFFVTKFSVFAANVRAISGNASLARNAGISIVKTKIGTICFGSLLCAVAALLSVSRGAGAATTSNLQSMASVFSAMMAFFIASAFARHINLTFGIIVGALCFSVLDVGLISINLPSNYNDVVVGVGLLVMLTVLSVNGRRSANALYREYCANRRIQDHKLHDVEP